MERSTHGIRRTQYTLVYVVLYDPRHLSGSVRGQMAGPDHADRGRWHLGLRAGSIGIVLAVDVHQRGSGQQCEQRERNEYGGQHGDLPVPEQRPCGDVQQTGVQQTRGEP